MRRRKAKGEALLLNPAAPGKKRRSRERGEIGKKLRRHPPATEFLHLGITLSQPTSASSQRPSGYLQSPRMFKEYFQYKGISFPQIIYSGQVLQMVEKDFQVRDDDIFNVTYQKSGTVWMLEILSLIRSNGDPSWCRTVPNWDRGPWYETVIGYRIALTNKSPRIISSHLPAQLFAKSFFKSKAKVIYTVRNPKDVLVSLYHFASMFRPFKDPGTLDQFLEGFLKGDVPFGSWFDHVKGWLNLKDKENFFFITYEELQEDLRGSVVRICQFLGKDLDDAAIDSVVANASFEAMKSNKMSNFSLSPRFLMNQKKSAFLRKGISGDWKNHLTTTQSECFDQVYQERLQDLNVTFPWDKE